MQELADRPLRVPQEPLIRHLWRMTRWLLELRLAPRLSERRGGWRAPLRALRDGLSTSGRALALASGLLLVLARPHQPGFDLRLAAAGWSLLLVCAVAGRLWRPRLQLQRLGFTPAIAGQPCRGRVRVTNVGRRAARDLMLREWRGPDWRPLPPSRSALIERLEVGESRVCETQLIPRARGLLRLPGVAVHSYFPLFLTRSTVGAALAQELPVLPPPLAVSLPPLRELAARCLGSGQHAAQQAGALEYAYSRAYQAGDPPTRLDHRASARRGQLMSRVFHGGAELRAGGIAICCDTAVAGFAPWQRRPRDATALDRRLALVLELAAQARAEALPLRALALGGHWQPIADEAALQRAVATCPSARQTCLPSGLPSDLPTGLPAAGLLYLLVTEDASEALVAQLAAWRAAGQVVLAFRLAGAGGRALAPGPGNHELIA